MRVGRQVLPADGDPARAGTQVTVLVRPEAVVVTPDPQGDATVMVATFRGSSTRLRLLMTDGTEVLADVPSHRSAELSPGTRASVALLDRPVLLASP